jgi:hypothetical protein
MGRVGSSEIDRELVRAEIPQHLTALLMNRIDIEGPFLQAQDVERHRVVGTSRGGGAARGDILIS